MNDNEKINGNFDRTETQTDDVPKGRNEPAEEKAAEPKTKALKPEVK